MTTSLSRSCLRALGLALVLGGCELGPPLSSPPQWVAQPQPSPPPPNARDLDAKLPGWVPENRARLDALMAARGVRSPSYDPRHRPVATFDWDNTMMRGDIGDATMAWVLRHDAILQPPARDWTVTSSALTAEALAALHACDKAGEPGHPLATAESPACADAIYDIYDSGRTSWGQAAWTKPIKLTTNEPYAWLARILAGHTPAEIQGFARAAFEEGSVAPIGGKQTVGTHADVSAWLRIYANMWDLVGALQSNGFDVWIVSASPQHVTEVVAERVGIKADHVVGIRSAFEAGGRESYHLEPCGDAPEDTVITFDQGKRCFINKVIFRLPVAVQLTRADAAHRPVFSAGDSDTDVAFVQDATDLKLVVNRNRVALMCNAYGNAGGQWMVQPMFFDPLPPRAQPYPCATTLDAAGRPIVDQAGQPMKDQVDAVFAIPGTTAL